MATRCWPMLLRAEAWLATRKTLRDNWGGMRDNWGGKRE